MKLINIKQFPTSRTLFFLFLRKLSLLLNIFFYFLLILLVYLVLNTLVPFIHSAIKTYTYNNIHNTSTVSCSYIMESEGCTHKIIEKVHQAKHLILIQRGFFASEAVISSLLEAEKKGVAVKIISDKNLKEYNFIPFDDVIRLWVDTKPDNYEEISNLSGGRQYEDIYIVSWTSSSDK